MKARSSASTRRIERLEELSLWRNAIARQDFDKAKLGGRTTLRLDEVRAWCSACNGLAGTFAAVMGHYVASMVGSNPW